jgi:hypothetical protein
LGSFPPKTSRRLVRHTIRKGASDGVHIHTLSNLCMAASRRMRCDTWQGCEEASINIGHAAKICTMPPCFVAVAGSQLRNPCGLLNVREQTRGFSRLRRKGRNTNLAGDPFCRFPSSACNRNVTSAC